MQDSFREEDISLGYLIAVGAQAGVRVDPARRDDDGVDANIRSDITINGQHFSSTFNVQLKATATHATYREDDKYIVYKLKTKNYNDLIKDSMTPLFLFLLILPENQEERVRCSPEELVIKKCMYWYRPCDHEYTNNSSTISIKIPKSQRVTPDEINKLLQQVMEER